MKGRRERYLWYFRRTVLARILDSARAELKALGAAEAWRAGRVEIGPNGPTIYDDADPPLILGAQESDWYHRNPEALERLRRTVRTDLAAAKGGRASDAYVVAVLAAAAYRLDDVDDMLGLDEWALGVEAKRASRPQAFVAAVGQRQQAENRRIAKRSTRNGVSIIEMNDPNDPIIKRAQELRVKRPHLSASAIAKTIVRDATDPSGRSASRIRHIIADYLATSRD